MKWFVLAGGFGSRMQPYTDLIPKCLLPIGGRPCCYWIVESLMQQGFDDITLCINKWAEEHFRFAFKNMVNIKFSVSEKPLGTVGELLWAIKQAPNSTFGVHYGDDLTQVDYKKLIDFHLKKQAVVTIAVTPQFRLPVGVVNLDDDGRIKEFMEKPLLNKYIWAAIAVLEPRAVAYFKFGEDIATHALPKMLEAGETIYAFINDEPWYDVGDVGAWRRADEHYKIQEEVKEAKNRLKGGGKDR